MLFINKLPFYIFLVYPILGYFTISYLGFPPFYILSILVLISFFFKLKEKHLLNFPRYLTYYLFYLIFVFISKYVVNEVPLGFDAQMAQIVFILSALLFYLIIENSSFTPLFIKVCSKLMKYLIFAAAVVSIIQYFIPSFFLYSEKYTGVDFEMQGYARRIPSIFTWGDLMNDAYIAIGFIIMYGILIVEYKGKKTLTTLLPILTGIVVFISQFRVAMLTYLISTIFLVFKKISLKSIFFSALLVLSFYIVTVFLSFNVDYFVENRLESESAYTRIEAFKAFFYVFPEKPYFGTGGERTEALFEGFGHKARLHNAHLAIAYYYGIFALLFHTLFLISLTKKTFKTGKKINYWPPFVGVLCYITATMTMPRGDFFEPGLIIMMVYHKFYLDRYLLQKQLPVYA